MTRETLQQASRDTRRQVEGDKELQLIIAVLLPSNSSPHREIVIRVTIDCSHNTLLSHSIAADLFFYCYMSTWHTIR